MLFSTDQLPHYSARAFWERVAPGVVRVWNELYFDAERSSRCGDEIPIYSDIVYRRFAEVAGRDPRHDQHGDALAQSLCIFAAEEVSRALYVADERYSLDGEEALTFAQGWVMAWRNFVAPENSDVWIGMVPVDELASSSMLAKMANGYAFSNSVLRQAFEGGWTERVSHEASAKKERAQE